MGTVGEGGRYGGIYMLGALVQEGRGGGRGGWLVPFAGFAESIERLSMTLAADGKWQR